MTARVSDELDRHAIPFITAPDDDGGTGISSKFEVNPDAVAYLESLKGKVAVVAIAGLYRTGKSYLLNAVRAGARGASGSVCNRLFASPWVGRERGPEGGGGGVQTQLWALC